VSPREVPATTARSVSASAEIRAARFPDLRPFEELPRAHRASARIRSRGAACLTTAELVALVVGGRDRSVRLSALASGIVRRHGRAGLRAMTVTAWESEAGIGPVSAVRLCAAVELGRRVHGSDDRARPKVSRPRAAWRHVRDLGRARKEHLVGLYLDAQNGLIGRETISVGSLNTTRTHPREILYPAVAHLALGFVLAHNHPSGCLEPSPEDVEFTRAVRKAGELMGIELYDHLIVAGDRFVSLRERGIL